MKKKFTKSLVAMFALVAMLTQNAYGVYAAATSPAPIVENEFADDEASTPDIEVVTDAGENTEEGTEVEYVDGDLDVDEIAPTDDVNYDDEVMPIDEDAEEEEIPENIEILDTQISGSGLDSVEIYIDTDELNSKDTFRIEFTSDAAASYDTILNEELSKSAGGYYTFSNLDKLGFNIRAKSDDDVSFVFTSKNGQPVIKAISNSEVVEKKLTRKSITLNDGSPVSALSGEGFENVKVNFDTDSLTKDLKFSFVIETEADVTVNGDAYDGKIKGLDNETDAFTVSGLDGKEFVMYVEPAGRDFITSEISEISDEDGTATIEIAGEETRVKRVYTYEDDQVSVTATLSDPKAVPDDAEFKVTPITVQKAVDAYIEALNDNSSEEIEYTEENTLLYDIAFLVDKKDEDGNVIEGEKVEFEPEVGRVKIEINYKKSQLSDELGAEESNDIEVKHLPLTDKALESVDATVDATSITASDIKVEDVRAEVVVTENGTDTVEFTTDSLSVYAFISSKNHYVELKKGADVTPKSVLDVAVRYGIVAEYVEQKAHMDSNFATKDYKSNGNNTTSGAYSKDANGNKVGFYYYVGKIQDSFKADGKENKVYVPAAYQGKITSDNSGTIDTSLTEEEIDDVVDSLLSTVKSNAAALLNESNNITKIEKVQYSDDWQHIIKGTKFPGHNNYFGQNNDGVIDLTDADAGTYYFDFDDFATAGKLEGFDIKLNDDQYVVFLYPTATDVRLGGYKVNGTASNNSVFASKHVLFYAPKAENFNIVETCGGTFIAPKATIDTTAGSPSGWIVVENFYNGSGEWHNVFDELPPVTIPTSVTFHVKKMLENNGEDRPAFKFDLYETASNYFTDKQHEGEPFAPRFIQTIEIKNYDSNDAGYAAFDAINYNKASDAGVHYYVVHEQQANKNGWSTDHEWGYAEVTVDAVKVGNDTKYEVTKIRACYNVSGPTGSRNLVDPKTIACQDPEFQITNSKTEIKEGTTVDFKASKLFKVDGTWPAGKTFRLKLEALDTSYDKVGHVSGKGPLPGGATEPIIITVDKDHPVADFGSIYFDYEPNDAEKVDPNWKWGGYQSTEYTPDMPEGAMFRAYLYKISEVMPADATAENDYTVDGIKYDPTVRYVKIFLNKAYNKATNAYELKKQIKVSYTNETGSCFEDEDIQAFTNDVAFETEISGTKTVLPKKVGLKAGDYKFLITAANGTPLPSPAYAYNDKDGNFKFNTIKYSSDDIGKTYIYTVEETVDSDKKNNAMHYSTEKYEVSVTVNKDGVSKLVKKVGSAENAGDTTPINFVNSLSAYGKLTFEAQKDYNLTLSGRDFSFKLEELLKDGSFKTLETQFNDENGKVLFKTVKEYSEKDITTGDEAYVYYISEVIPEGNNNGITYDKDIYRYTVKVTDGGADAEIIEGKAKLNIDTVIDKSSDGGKTWNSFVGTPKFTNTYIAKGKGAITVKKNIGTDESLSAKTLATKKFYFKVTETDSPNTEKYSKELEVTGPGTAVFDEINFEKAGTYKFTVEETHIPSGAVNGVYEGITYDTKKHEVVMVVKDNGQGGLVIESQKNDENTVNVNTPLVITNEYKVDKTTTTIEGTKAVTGRATLTEDDIYTFVIEAVNNAPLPEITEVQNNTAGKFEFGPITYTQEGDYSYTVYEKDTNVPGITKDLKVYKVTVPVKDNGKGALEVGNKIYEVNSKPEQVLKFTNEYKAEGEEYIHVKKVFKSDVKTLKGGEFSFELCNSDSNKTRIGELIQNDANGNATFPVRKFTLSQLEGEASKTFTYYVREVVTNKVNGYTYDETYHQVDITVTNNTKTGQLDTSVKYYNDDNSNEASIITNSYDAKGETTISGTKTMVGRSIGKDEQIKIVLEPISATTLDGSETINDPNAVTGGAANQVTYVTKKLFNGDQGTFTFEKKLEYTKPGLYTYRVYEVANTEDKVTEYDDTIYTVTVKVEDATSDMSAPKYGELKCTRTYSVAGTDRGNIAFINKSNGKNEFTPVATKKFITKTGENPVELKAGAFEFKITETKPDGTVVETNKTYKNQANTGLVTFDEYQYTADTLGTHVYTIKEVTGDRTDVEYSTDEYKIEVLVYEDEVTHEIKYTDTYYKKDSTGWTQTSGSAAVVFTNYYKAEGDVNFKAYKVIKDSTGNISKTVLPKEGEFSFDLYEGTNNIGSASIDENGEASFSIHYTEADLTGSKTSDGKKFVKYYTIKENKDNPKLGFTYSDQEYSAVVTLEDKGNGTIETKCNIIDENKAPEEKNVIIQWFKDLLNIDTTEAKFENVYEAEGSVVFNAHKTFTGGKALSDDMFTFILLENGKEKERVTNKGEEVKFSAINYKSEDIGTHEYTIKEVKGNISGVTYSEVEYKATVVVSDLIRDGKLEINTSITDETSTTSYSSMIENNETGECLAGPVEFINNYIPQPTTIQVGGNKVLSGLKDNKTIADYNDKFTFVMTNAENNTKEFSSTVNNTNGSFLFDEISFSQDDLKVIGEDGTVTYLDSKNFDYVITETTGDLPGIDYDTTAKNITIVLKDNKDGSLSAYVDGHKDDPKASVTFNNAFVDDGELVVGVSKTTPGANNADKLFKFTMTGSNDYSSVVNITAGKSGTFKKITYDLAKVKAAPNKKIVEQYVVKEDNTNPHNGYTYSTAEYVIDVEVTYNEATKKLDIVKKVNGAEWTGALNFEYENPYKATGSTSIYGKKVVKNAPSLVKEGAFSFELRNEDSSAKWTTSNDANGDFSFAITGPNKEREFNATDDGKTYKYYLREITPDKDNITGVENVKYTNEEVEILVTVKDNGDGTLTVTPNKGISKSESIVFTNEFESTTQKSFSAHKSVEGRGIENIFQFKLEDISKDKKFKDPEIIYNQGEAVNFETEVKFDQNDIGKTFLYRISEVEGKYKPPYTYSNEKFYSKITVSVENGQLVADQKYYADEACTTEILDSEVKFVNKYESKTEVEFSGTKFLEGQKDGDFEFVLFDTKENKEVEKVKVNGQQAFKFKAIEYNQNDLKSGDSYLTEREYTYTVKEVNGGEKINGLQYSDTVYSIKVLLTYDDTTKKLKAVPTIVSSNGDSSVPSDKLNFTNVYSAKGSLPLLGTKAVTGKNLVDGYKFALSIDGVKVAEASNVGDTFTFKPGKNTIDNVTYKFFEYDQTDIGKTYTYTVTEMDTTDGTNKDETVYTITDTITKNTENGELVISRTVKNNKNETVGDENNSGIVFTNTYWASGSIILDGKKTMKNRNLDKEVFRFVIKDSDGNILKDSKGNEYSVTNTEDIAKDDNKEAVFEFKFPAIEYSQVDLKEGSAYLPSKTFYYTVEEVGTQEGVTNSQTIYTVAVTVEDSGKNDHKLNVTKKVTSNVNESEDTSKGLLNILKARFTKADDVPIEFVNEYNASGNWDPEGTKELTGREFGNNEFQFTITEIDADGKVVKDGSVERVASVPNQGTKVKFDHNNVSWLNYTIKDEGTHYYKVRELDPGVKADLDLGAINNGWADKYDKTVFEYTVEVKDDKTGTLVPTVTEVKAYNEDGTLRDASSDASFKFNFKNEYAATGSIDLHATKKVTGRDIGDDKYDFIIEEVKNGSVVKSATVQNNGQSIDFLASEISFLNYTREDLGNHEYVIREKDLNPEYADLKKDLNVYKVTVNVADNTVDGKPVYDGHLDVKVLKVEKQLSAIESSWEKFVGEPQLDSLFTFDNTYSAKASINFVGVKHLRRAELATEDITSAAELAGRFEFAVYQYANADRTGERVEVNRTSCDGDGKYILRGPSFDEKTLLDGENYLDSKVLYYQIEERKPSEGTWNDGKFTGTNGVTYDNTVYNIDVTVKPAPKGSNNLVVEVKNAETGEVITAIPNTDNLYTIGGAGYFDFVNIKPVKTHIEGTKTWNDGGLAPANRPNVVIELRSSEDNFASVIDTYTIVAPSTEYAFNDLPATDKFGKGIEYMTTEREIPGYVSEKVGNNFINTKGDIIIRKIDSVTGTPVAGAELAILTLAGEEIETWTSEAAAHVVEATLTRGTRYILREKKAPSGYIVAADIEFTVPENGGEIVVTMEDEPMRGAVRLRKLDADSREALSGAEFALYSDTGARVYASGTPGSYRYSATASNGRFAVNGSGTLEILDLPAGTYYFTEITAPSGYSLSSERAGFTILNNEETVEVTFLNSKVTGAVRLRKANADGTRSLAGAVFELYAKTPSSVSAAIASTIYRDAYYRVGSYTTDESGIIYVGDLPWDDYYFVEVQAPDGYTLNRDTNGDLLVYAFTIGEGGTRDMVYDLGTITNSFVPELPPTPPRRGEVRGERRDRGRRDGGVLSGVLGVRAAPKSGVLGERLGPVTGDAANIFLWMLLLLASVGAIVGVFIANARRKRNAAR